MVADPASVPDPASGPTAPQPRTGAALILATRVFAEEHTATSWGLLGATLVPLSVLLAVAACGPHALMHIASGTGSAGSAGVFDRVVQVLAGLIAGLVQVRLFIFYHDALHGAIFRRSWLGRRLMDGVGMYLLTARSVWRESHDFHHQHNSKPHASHIGSFPVRTVEDYRHATPAERRGHDRARHPLTMALGYVTLFMGGMVVAPAVRNLRRHWAAPAALAAHIALVVGIGLGVGWMTAFCAVVLPVGFALTVGGYLFYAQHNFPAMQLVERADWCCAGAATQASSLFVMGPVMRWMTGSIGYHHVHHLNHRIPFYRLREAMAALPELQHPGRTSWRIPDILSCLHLHLWDPAQGRMLTRRETRLLLDR